MKVIYNDVQHLLLQVKPDRRLDVWNWGIDNARPSTLEYLLDNSPTAKVCVDKIAKSIYGKGVKDGNFMINKEGYTLNDVIRTLAREYAKHNNAFISIQYNGDYEISQIKVIPTKYMRVGKSDDLGYSGKLVMYNNWDRSQDKAVKPSEFITIDRFNPNKEVIKAQVEAAGGWSKYRGQVIHIQKYLNEVYSLADGETVENHMVSEIHAGLFMAKGAAEGFVGTKAMVVKPFPDDESRAAFLRRIDQLKGVNNANSMLVMEAEEATADLDNIIKVMDLTSEYNDGLFLNTEQSTEAAIIKAFNVPPMLVSPSDSGLFGNSGELINSAKRMMWQEREEERDKLEEILSRILTIYKDPITEPIEIISPYEDPQPIVEEVVEEITEEENIETDDSTTGTEEI